MKKAGYFLCLAFLFLIMYQGGALASGQTYQLSETNKIVTLVKDAAALVQEKGEAAFPDFKKEGSRWRQGETYIFVVDLKGNMLVHPDPTLEGKNQLELKSINGKPIIRGLLEAVTVVPGKPEAWFHYKWPVPGGLTPRWKSTYARQVKAPSGKSYMICSGMYTDRMEKEFVVELVKNAAAEIEKKGKEAFKSFHDPGSQFLAKDAYIIVVDMNGIELANPAFGSFEGKSVLDLNDAKGKFLIREMLKVAEKNGSGWVDYMWPKPGESTPSKKSTYVKKVKLGDKWVVVGCGVYLEDHSAKAVAEKKMTAPELMALVREAAKIFEQKGEKAFPEFRKKGTKWYQEDTYFFVWSLDGVRTFHATNPASEGKDVKDHKDAMGRPIGKMFLAVANTPAGEEWVHYLWPEPGAIFPDWKSTFLKVVTFPSGKKYIVGCGIYNMEMNKAFIEDLVNHAAELVAKDGKASFDQLRDKTGPFVFMDTYVFVENPDGAELVNVAQPTLEGKNLMNEKDLKGKPMVREYIEAAMKNGSAWVENYWYKPGENTASLRHTYVKKVKHGNETYILGSGYFEPVQAKNASTVPKTSNAAIPQTSKKVTSGKK